MVFGLHEYLTILIDEVSFDIVITNGVAICGDMLKSIYEMIFDLKKQPCINRS